MNTITSIIQASNNDLNNKTASILFEVAKKNFITSTEIIEKLQSDDFNQRSVISNIGVLLKKGLIEKSGEGYITTDNSAEILTLAANIYAENNPTSTVAVKVEKEKMVGKKRITDEMTSLIKDVETRLKDFVDTKDIITNRSNYEIALEKRTLGVRSVEIRHKGLLRFCTYKINPELLQAFIDSNLIVNNKESGVVNYIDFESTHVNIEIIFDIFKMHQQRI